MASLADLHPAFEVPPGSSTCCHCLGLPVNTCPDFVFQGKQCSGTANGVAACGFFNIDDGKYYTKKTTTNTREVRDVSPPPHEYTCEIDSGARRVTVGTVEVEVPYNSVVEEICTVNEDTLECQCETNTTEATYTLTRQLVRLYDISDTDCNGEFLEVPGAFITELDPDASVFDEVTYSEQWEQPSAGALQGNAETNAESNCSEDWTDTPVALKSFVLDEDDQVIECLTVNCQTRIRITGGNSGYIRIVYGVMDENGTITSEQEVVYEWDPTLGGADAVLPGPELPVTWPSGIGADTFRLSEMVLIETSCIRPTP